MEDGHIRSVPRTITSVWPAVILLAVACAVLAAAWTYPPVASRFPVMVAVAMIVLTIFDIWSRTDLPGSRVIEAFGGAGFSAREMTHDPSLGEQWACVGWIALSFALMAVAGILAASPIFVAAFVRYRGKRTWTVAFVTGLIVLAFQFAVFEWALDYELYRGLFVTRGGISAW